MPQKFFLVCGNIVYGTGYPVQNKTAVIEAIVDDSGRAQVIAPQEFTHNWQTVRIAGSRESWVECEGPARLLDHREWLELLASVEPSVEAELRLYGWDHMIDHMRSAGISDEQIERALATLPSGPGKEHFITQFLEKLPEEKREASALRLQN